MRPQSAKTCPVCASPQVDEFFEWLNVPVYCNLLWQGRQTARHCPRGDIKLAFCRACGFIFNVAFDPTRLEYGQEYENSLHFSPLFQDYARSLATRLIARCNLFGKDVIEIGCGKGDFLLLLCELGNNRGIGFDPSYAGRTEYKHVKFIQDFYSERYADYPSDLVCCRQTLEHIQNPAVLLNTLRRAIRDRLNTIVFFEVPNTLYTIRHHAIWDIIYEHCSYFIPHSLRRVFSCCGFRVSVLTEEFGEQFLCIEARPTEKTDGPAHDAPEEVKQVADDITAFAADFRNDVSRWKSKLRQIQDRGQRAVIWGAGSKAVTFLNTLGIEDEIAYVVDINPRKQGMYAAGTGQRIVAPEFLRSYQPETVIVMNPIYQNEIRQFTNGLGIRPEFLCPVQVRDERPANSSES